MTDNHHGSVLGGGAFGTCVCVFVSDFVLGCPSCFQAGNSDAICDCFLVVLGGLARSYRCLQYMY